VVADEDPFVTYVRMGMVAGGVTGAVTAGVCIYEKTPPEETTLLSLTVGGLTVIAWPVVVVSMAVYVPVKALTAVRNRF
jgi:hypothetical protein